jgi:hypothetical protein
MKKKKKISISPFQLSSFLHTGGVPGHRFKPQSDCLVWFSIVQIGAQSNKYNLRLGWPNFKKNLSTVDIYLES